MTRLYRLELDDYSCPSFVSSSKSYFGTREQLKGFFDTIRSDKETAECCSDILSMFDRFLLGEKNLTHLVAFREVPFLVYAKVLGTATSELNDYKWEHLNTWDCPYYLKCKKADNTHIWVSCHGKYFRCILTEFTDIEYSIDEGIAYNSLGGTWGHPGQIQVTRGNLHNQLYVIEKVFKNKKEVLEDQANFANNPVPDFTAVLEDVFGDG